MLKAPAHISSIKPYIPGKPVEELERELGISYTPVRIALEEELSGKKRQEAETI